MEYSQKDVIVGEQWLILSKIGEGSFGEVFKAQDIHSKKLYAVKRESLDLEHPQLHHESMIYDLLVGGPCIPSCDWYGQYDGFNCIVIDLLGSSLKDLQQSIRNIPLEIIIDIGCQLISCIEYIHDRGLVYRDIKPENFLFSSNCIFSSSQQQQSSNNSYNSPPPSPPLSSSSSNNNILSNTWDHKVYIVDFGLTTWWRNPKTKKPYSECKKPIKYKTGTARYASLNVHRGRTHARRDDMESLGYLLLDLLLNGELPWSGVTARTSKLGWDRLKSIKEEILLQDLCLGLPHGIMDFISYTRNLRFNDRPDYDYLKRLLIGCNATNGGPYSKLVLPHPNTRLIPSPPKYFSHQQQQASYTNNYQQYNNNDYGGAKRRADDQYRIKRRNSTSNHYYHNNQNYGNSKYYYNHYQQQSTYQQHQHQQHQSQQEDVFIMDDLLKELPTTSASSAAATTTTTPSVNNNYNNTHIKKHSHSSSSHYHHRNRYYPNSNDARPPPPPSLPTHQFNANKKKIGWNSHKNYAPAPAVTQNQWE